MPKVGVVLSGCGVFDGSEIHEAVLTLLALDRRGAEVVCMAPASDQAHVVDHARGDVSAGERRNLLVESARIARGVIRDISGVRAVELDALVLPGGYGAAKNLSDFASKGADCAVHPEVARLILEMHAAGKPIGAICIAPAVLARVLGQKRIAARLTIGTDAGTAGAIVAMGGIHVTCPVRECVVDREHKIVSTPAYMLAQRIAEVADGIDGAVAALLALIG
ncbi:MAG TPA: isoprenoid biosynthesis glyoxalase ElbB [Acidobacteriota bacterium]|nr:isoprenoid biosynthesis glyoxalase ElbB [Acidobacteriota bacterium]HQF86620.1 isoprenoid biosynthesis glyoxalase ElbB [Acidobacteriota bacterium]HQG90128.1 isoprenoid biosynthesis glyoxalase ElbB [Acidobacteriota bacterium]HQK88418.1 isoprenoid biosynthesis glyoxalase ElbB [Acidobacteriota bacterium]